MIEVNFDGSSKGNPSNFGWVGAYINQDGRRMHTISHEIQGRITSNVAEYAALEAALAYLVDNKLTQERIVVRGDSQLVINQMLGKYKIRGGVCKQKALEVKEMVGKFKDITFEWVPREQNEIADGLANNKY